MPSSGRKPTEVRFCLDANLSYRVADAIDPGTAEVVHVSRVVGLASSVRGRSDAPDTAVAAWCVENEAVLVTCDEDFRARSARTQELADSGLEVIVFAHEIQGLQNQINVISRRLAGWRHKLAELPYSPRVWIQYSHGPLRLDK